tara:strand:- start:85 stop:264 length:180 start_codon:yes stop_codon:yes gene_type:complete
MPPPAGTDIQHLHAGPVEKELGRYMLLLLLLGTFQRVVGMPEIGAGILPVAVEEEVVEL